MDSSISSDSFNNQYNNAKNNLQNTYNSIQDVNDPYEYRNKFTEDGIYYERLENGRYEINYPNGYIYIGQVDRNLKPHGNGELRKNDIIYEGLFVNNVLRNGIVTRTEDTGNTIPIVNGRTHIQTGDFKFNALSQKNELQNGTDLTILLGINGQIHSANIINIVDGKEEEMQAKFCRGDKYGSDKYKDDRIECSIPDGDGGRYIKQTVIVKINGQDISITQPSSKVYQFFQTYCCCCYKNPLKNQLLSNGVPPELGEYEQQIIKILDVVFPENMDYVRGEWQKKREQLALQQANVNRGVQRM